MSEAAPITAEAAPATIGPLGIAQVMALLPHRFPMLLVDRVEEVVSCRSARGVKAVTINEPFFQGHFPKRPIMPGVLIIEALAQVAGVLAIASMGDAAQGKLLYFMAIDDAKFRAPVEPGCLLNLKIEVTQMRGRVWKFLGVAEVDGKLCAQVNFTAMVADPPAEV